MRKILSVAKREYIETTKTKAFFISILLAPVIGLGIIFFAGKLAQKPSGPRAPVSVAVADFTGELGEQIKTRIEEHNQSDSQQILFQSISTDESGGKADLMGKNKLRLGKINAYIAIEKGVLEQGGKVQFYTYKPKPSDMDAFWTIERLINNVVIDKRCEIKNISRKVLSEIRDVKVERLEIEGDSEKAKVQKKEDSVAIMMVPFFFMFMIYMGIVGIGQQMLSSVIEEKNSRIIEVLLSAISPFELMAGKILGLAGVGFTVMGLWTIAAYGSVKWQGIPVEIEGSMIVLAIVYYILGFIFFSAILAGIGSICNTLKDSQTLMMPIIMMFIIPMISWFNLVKSPNGLYARVLSFIPPVTPLVMVLRISAGEVSVLEIAGSIILLALSVLGAIWLAARIFRTGILMYGKRPSFREIVRWFRQS